MKALLASIPNRLKAIYLVWFTIQFTLFNIGPEMFRVDEDFYPIDWRGHLTFRTIDYDYTEFLFYIFVPILIYMIVRLWKKK